VGRPKRREREREKERERERESRQKEEEELECCVAGRNTRRQAVRGGGGVSRNVFHCLCLHDLLSAAMINISFLLLSGGGTGEIRHRCFEQTAAATYLQKGALLASLV
jgi:hypothetical protein